MRDILPAGALALFLLAAPAAAEALAVTDGYDWALRIDEDRVSDAVLAYEVAETDDQPLSFACEEGGNRIFATIIGGAPDLAEITLTSGDRELRVAGKSVATEIEDMPYFTSQEIAGDAPVMAAFAANGWLRMTVGGTTVDMAATAAGKRAIERFIAFCAG